MTTRRLSSRFLSYPLSRVWVGRVRAHICETMTITRGKLVALNPSFFAPLCRHVKTLHFTWPRNTIDLSGSTVWIASKGLSCTPSSFLHANSIASTNRPYAGASQISLSINNNSLITRCLFYPQDVLGPLVVVSERRQLGDLRQSLGERQTRTQSAREQDRPMNLGPSLRRKFQVLLLGRSRIFGLPTRKTPRHHRHSTAP